MPVETRSKKKKAADTNGTVAAADSKSDQAGEESAAVSKAWTIDDALEAAGWLWTAPLLAFFVVDVFFVRLSHLQMLIGFHPMIPVVLMAGLVGAVRIAVAVLGKLDYPVAGLFFSDGDSAGDTGDSSADDDDKAHTE